MNTTYYITSSGETQWHEANAKTLLGAKREATKEYNLSVGGKLRVGERVTYNENTTQIEDVAVKYGYEAWGTK